MVIKYGKIIEMPRVLPDSYKTIKILSEIQNTIINCKEDRIVLDFQNCIFSHALFTSFIGALGVIAHSDSKIVVFRVKNPSKLYTYIYDSGLYDFMQQKPYSANNKNVIPFTSIDMNDDAIIDYTNKILIHSPVELESNVDQQLFKNLYEILSNAVEHSHAKHGIYGCGHWFPKRQELAFSVYDTGIGIDTSVKRKINPSFSSKEAIKWSFEINNSTKQLDDCIPRGVGLPEFLEFIKRNNGELSIICNDICYIYNNKEIFHTLQYPIEGTIISFIIKS